MACSSDTELSEGEDCSCKTDGQLWAVLPRQLRKELGGDGGVLPAPDVLAFLVDSECEAQALVREFADDARAAARLVELQRRALPIAQQMCKRRARVDPADQFSQISKKLPRLEGAGLQDTISWLRKLSGARLRTSFRTAPKARAQRLGQSRAAREAEVLRKARAELAELLVEAKPPISAQADQCREPEKVVAAAVGGVRASTIRKRMREWRKVRAFSLGVAGVPWPPHIGLVLDYVQERIQEPCARTVPAAILSALGFMEKSGGVTLSDRMANQQTLKNMVNQSVMDLESGAAPTKKAPLLPLVLVGALELLVLDAAQPPFARGMAWYKLLKVWTACRCHGLSGLSPGSLRLTKHGLVGSLERTKTTGPGKKVRHLPIFVSNSAFFMAPQWLSVGLQIWQQEQMNFERDYFLPLPSLDWTGVRPAMADYGDIVGLSKQLLRYLRQPVWAHGQWQSTSQPLLIVEAAFKFWTEHSERNWLNSLSAALGFPAEERSMVGRWGVSSSADDYLRTAQQVIVSLQEKLVVSLRGENRWDLRHAGLEELKQHLHDHNVGMAIASQQCKLLSLDAASSLIMPAPTTFTVPPDPPAATDEDEEVDVTDSPYFVTIVGSRRFRRLHRRGGCGVSAIEVQACEAIWSLKGLSYDLACKHCWRAGENITLSEVEEADDSEPGSEASDRS